MSSEKAVRRKQDTNGGQQAATTPHTPNSDDTPNHLVYKKVNLVMGLTEILEIGKYIE